MSQPPPPYPVHQPENPQHSPMPPAMPSLQSAPQRPAPQWPHYPLDASGRAHFQQPRSNNLGWGCLAILIMLVLALVAGLMAWRAVAPVVAEIDTDQTPHTVQLVVTTTQPVHVSWQAGDTSGSFATRDTMTRKVEVNGHKVVTMTVTPDPTAKPAVVACEVLVDGALLDQRTSDGKGGLASCTGRIK